MPEQTEADVQKSLERLDAQRDTLVGDTAEDRTMTGSTTWETLPEDNRPEKDEPLREVEVSQR